MTLEDLGFDPFFSDRFNVYKPEGLSAARVTLEHKNSFVVYSELGEIPAVLSGKMHHESDREELPVVGDWTAVQLLDEKEPWAVVHAVLPRKSKISRKEAGQKTREQPLAANVDTVFVVTGLDYNFSPRRIERYLTLIWESGAQPVVLLTKSDLCDSTSRRIKEIESSAPGTPVHAISALTGEGMDALTDYTLKGKTLALLGSSGVGKSTIINRLLGEDVQKVQEVRDLDSKGRHTTSHRQLFVLPGGVMVIDTPGMRELQLWSADSGLTGAFEDVETLAKACRFQDCSHTTEPGCKIAEALKSGELDPGRFENYRKMQKELDHLARKQDAGAARAERLKWKAIHKTIRHFKKQ